MEGQRVHTAGDRKLRCLPAAWGSYGMYALHVAMLGLLLSERVLLAKLEKNILRGSSPSSADQNYYSTWQHQGVFGWLVAGWLAGQPTHESTVHTNSVSR